MKKRKGRSFSFGKNWQDFLRKVSKANIIIAKNSLKELFGNVKNNTFLDLGCGSGLFSYAMYLLGAKEITSFDVDPFSVQCVNFLKNKIKKPEKWKIFQGSILDKVFISQFEKFDIVYSWGVLHHTGNMWQAIKNSISLIKDGGFLCIALYNKTRTSKIWLLVKISYNRMPKFGKLILDYIYFSIYHFVYPLVMLKNPFKQLKEYVKKRGMSPIIDIKDWLGGYPYEYASAKEVIDFFNTIDSKFNLIKYTGTKLNGCNEFLFQKI